MSLDIISRKQDDLEVLQEIANGVGATFMRTFSSVSIAPGKTRVPSDIHSHIERLNAISQSRSNIMLDSSETGISIVSACLDHIRFALFHYNELFEMEDYDFLSSSLDRQRSLSAYFLERSRLMPAVAIAHAINPDAERQADIEARWRRAERDRRRVMADISYLSSKTGFLSDKDPHYYTEFWQPKKQPRSSFCLHLTKQGDLFARAAYESLEQLENISAYVNLIDTVMVPNKIGELCKWQQQKTVLIGESRRTREILPQMIDLAGSAYKTALRYV